MVYWIVHGMVSTSLKTPPELADSQMSAVSNKRFVCLAGWLLLVVDSVKRSMEWIDRGSRQLES